MDSKDGRHWLIGKMKDEKNQIKPAGQKINQIAL